MIDILKETEAIPAAYPDAPSGLSTAAAALDADMIWARIEAYTAHRFTPREVVWVMMAEAEDEWSPRLTPLVSHTAEQWNGVAWMTIDLIAGPLGFCLPYTGNFQITAQVGAGEVPAPVSEAFRRLAEYSAEIGADAMVAGHNAHHSHSVNIGSAVQESFDRSPTWAARAIQLSGAADLLRPYRRA